ncbi:MAG: hypothetical protein ACOX2O_03995 [Bdellovibrionota bacterium]|jgi:hypothetical protein
MSIIKLINIKRALLLLSVILFFNLPSFAQSLTEEGSVLKCDATPYITLGEANTQSRANNHETAYELYKKLLTDPETFKRIASENERGRIMREAFRGASESVSNFKKFYYGGYGSELDDFLTEVTAPSTTDWRILHTAGLFYIGGAFHPKAPLEFPPNASSGGCLISGKFFREYLHNYYNNDSFQKRSPRLPHLETYILRMAQLKNVTKCLKKGRRVSSPQRDRVLGLQLLLRAARSIPYKTKSKEVCNFYLDIADTLADQLISYRDPFYFSNSVMRGEFYSGKNLTDLETLPAYIDLYFHSLDRRHYDTSLFPRPPSSLPYPRLEVRFRPDPLFPFLLPDPLPTKPEDVYYELRESFEKAKNDGERWRWALQQVVEHAPSREVTEWQSKTDLRQADFLAYKLQIQHSDLNNLPKELASDMPSLKDSETIAKFATGIKKVTLPDKVNFIKIYKKIIERGDSMSYVARDSLCQIYRIRQQPEKIKIYCPSHFQPS